MLEGRTEFSIIGLSKIEKIKNRIDSEYYKKNYLELERKINLIGKVNLKGINAKLDCSAFYPSITDYYNFQFEGVPFLRVNEIQNGLVTITSNTAFLPQKVLNDNPSTIATAHPNDIVIAKGGNTLAKLGLITNQYSHYALSRDLILLRTENLKDCNKYFLWVFLHSKYGQDLLWRTASQTGQPHLTLPSVEEIGLPRYSSEFESKFETLYKQSSNLKEKSKQVYLQAENLLLEAVGLKEFELSKEKTNVKNFSNSFLSTGRLDAEYYQPKYEQVVNHIKTQKHARLTDLVNIKKSIEPGSAHYSDEGLPFLRVADYNKFGITEPDKKLSPEFCAEHAKLIETLKPKRDTILFSKDGSVGTAYRLRENLEVVTSGAVLHLTIKNGVELLPDYLTLALNSKLVQMQAERDAGGSIILHWRTEEIQNVVVPIVATGTQEKIAELIEESFRLKKESENLLETAKRAVEMAIEETEEVAIEFINAETR